MSLSAIRSRLERFRGLGRRSEMRKQDARCDRLEDNLHGKAIAECLPAGADQATDHSRTLFQLNENEGVGDLVLDEWMDGVMSDDPGVHRATSSNALPSRRKRMALWAHRPRRVTIMPAVRAALDAQ